VWFAVTILLYLVIVSSLASVAKDPKHASTVIALVATALVAYSCLAWALLPRFVLRRTRRPLNVEQMAAIRWTFAMSPFVYGLGSVAAGGQQWSLALGTVVSVILLALAVRAIRRPPVGV
jgi:hypothetical protein